MLASASGAARRPLVFPTRREWALATFLGFRSNGCSSAPDALVLGGAPLANGDNRYPPLPCDLHDYRYWRGGDEVERALADAELYVGIFAVALRARRTWGSVLYELWVAQALEYFKAVRCFGEDHWRLRRYEDPPRFFG